MPAPENAPGRESASAPGADKKIAAVIVQYGHWQDTVACVESLLRSQRPLQWVIVVDNASPDDSAACLQDWATGKRVIEYERWPGLEAPPAPKPLDLLVLSDPAGPGRAKPDPSALAAGGDLGGNLGGDPGKEPRLILLCKTDNTGYAGGNNRGLELGLALGADAFWIVNNDVVAHPEACEALARRTFASEKTGLVGCCVRYMHDPDIVQCCGGERTNTWTLLSKMIGQDLTAAAAMRLSPEDVERELTFVYGASLMASRAFVESVGLMDERFFMYCEELDWALRAGEFTLGYAPGAHVLHKEGASTGMRRGRQPFRRLRMLIRSRLLLAAKHFPHRLPVVLCGMAYATGRMVVRKITS